MPTRQIAASTLWQLASQIAMAALSILTVKFVTLGLTKELAGIYNSAYGFLQLFGILADFGLYAVGVRELSRATDRSAVLGALIALRSMILAVSLGAALLVVWLVPAWTRTPLPLSVTIAALVPFFTLLAGVLRGVFQVTYRMHVVFIAEVTQRVITTGLIGFFILLGVRGSHDLQVLHMFLFTGGIGAFVLFLISLVAADRTIPVRVAFDGRIMKALARSALPFGAAFLFTALYRQFDVTLIALLRPDFELQNAYYGFVLRMADMGFIIPTFLLNSVLPVLSERDARGEDARRVLGTTLLALLALGITSMLFALLWARPLISLMTTPQYLSMPGRPGSDTALMLLAAPMLLNGFIQYGFYVLLTKLRWKPLVTALGIGALISLILNVLLIPSYGFIGAAWSSIVTHVVLTAVLLPMGLRAMPAHIPLPALVRLGAWAILLAATLWSFGPLLTNDLTTLIALAAMAVVLPVLGMATGVHRFAWKGQADV